MYRPHTLAVATPTSVTAESQCSTRLRHQSRNVSGHVVVVMDSFSVARFAVPQAFYDTQPPGRRALEGQLFHQRFEQLIGVTRVNTVRLQVTGGVGAGRPEIPGCSGQVGGTPRAQQIQTQVGVLARPEDAPAFARREPEQCPGGQIGLRVDMRSLQFGSR